MKIFVAVPAHSETLTGGTVNTLLELQRAALEGGHEIRTLIFSGAMIGELRNVMSSAFMETGFDRMLMLDSDQAAPAEMLMNMLSFDNPVVGCLYPKRMFAWDKVRDYAYAKSLRDVLYRAQAFVGELELGQGAQVQFKVDNGFAEARRVGGGCLVIDRRCMEAMAQSYPELKDKGFERDYYPLAWNDWNYGIFNHGWSEANGMLLSEDYSFCERWRKIGGKIYAEVTSNTGHIGRYRYEGNFLDHLQALYSTQVQAIAPTAPFKG